MKLIIATSLAPIVLATVIAGLCITHVINTWAWELVPAVAAAAVYLGIYLIFRNVDFG